MPMRRDRTHQRRPFEQWQPGIVSCGNNQERGGPGAGGSMAMPVNHRPP